MFGGTTKINGIPNAIDQGVHNLHSHSEVQTFKVNDDDVKGLQRRCFKVRWQHCLLRCNQKGRCTI
jgi:hypothetical protein